MSKLLDIASRYKGITGLGIDEVLQYYNKHCVHLVKPTRRYYMRHGDDWCMAFLSVVAHKAGLTSDIFPYEVSVYYACEIAKQNGSYVLQNPDFVKQTPDFVKQGDLVVFDWGKGNRYNHIGFIDSIDVGVITTIEGNYSGTVGNRRVRVDNKAIRGYILLDRVKRALDGDIDRLAREVIRGLHGNGSDRIKALGDNYNAVQRRVNQLLK